MHLEDLKKMDPKELLETANSLEIEGSATMNKQELIFAILQAQSEKDVSISGKGFWKYFPMGSGSFAQPITATSPVRTTYTFLRRRSGGST